MTPPNLILGTGGFASSWSTESASQLPDLLKPMGINRIDTAAIYPVTAPGEAEKLLGAINFVDHGFKVDTKIAYGGDGSGTLTEAAVQKSVEQSLASLKTKAVNVLYCHGPDKKTPISEQAAALHAQYEKGLFTHLGVCNFSPSMLSEWLAIASEKGYVKPSVFQGQYNALCRTYEKTLFPLLREHGISFVGFSPLAGGFLTGKLTYSQGDDDLKGTRFEVTDGNYMGMGFRHWYDKPSMHKAVRKLSSACEEHGISTQNAALRWVVHHSGLTSENGDAVIIGPSNVEQLKKYKEAVDQGALPAVLVDVLDGVWESVENDASNIVVY
ncbi:Aldo/keto reductase [Delitschia confertaspora ATCC 74209]|uniref:Aldo/keto reductase n=1 Tax=Delitschia confertaspora ATCC 74209 TaxID=1513339 RepID=A0A9P4JKV5_9PLEO|nr:Aldo/keto reductase [Delitschia confertaspora ATCC 74209]